jgi:hypothetical protein
MGVPIVHLVRPNQGECLNASCQTSPRGDHPAEAQNLTIPFGPYIDRHFIDLPVWVLSIAGMRREVLQAPRIYRAFTRSVELLFELTGSSVELVTCAVFVIHPPAVPVIVVVSVYEALAPLARDGMVHVTTRVDAA